LTLAFVLVAVPTLVGVLLRYWPHTAIGKKFFLSGPTEQAEAIEAQEEKLLESLLGHTGTTLSALRPAGVVDFAGRRVDVITEGMLVERGQLVRCIEIRAGKVVVRPVLSQTPADEPGAGEWNIQ
jgi:membrane-bound serine protease (ClpP class)